jgi:hypothetical protein
MNSIKPSQHRKNSYDEPLDNTPFPYCHIYNCLLRGKYGEFWLRYTMFCDYLEPKDRQNISELKYRIQLFYPSFKLIKYKVIKGGVNG